MLARGVPYWTARMNGGAYESDLLNLWEQAMRNRSLASNRLFRVPTLLPKNDESTLPRERAAVGAQEANTIKMYSVSRHARQHSGRFSVVALLAHLWRPF
jgi:hypothetical protein